MHPKIYQVLPEAEPFSACRGGAISRWVANVVCDDPHTLIVCPSADGTWKLHGPEIRRRAAYNVYARVLRCAGRLPQLWSERIVRKVLRSAFHDLQAGDVLWIHNRPLLSAAMMPIASRAGARVVLHLHNSHLNYYHGPVIADRVTFCSGFLERESRESHPELGGGMIIHNGADDAVAIARNFDASPTHPFTALFVGRLVPEKGAHIFLDAMRLLNDKGMKIRGRIVGTSRFGYQPQSAYFDQLLAAAPPNVKFVGYKSGVELADEYRHADVFCCPSIWQEPFGMVNVEAMASALPVVASAVGGIPEVFREGGGILVPPADPEKLASAIESLARSPGLRARLASAGHASFLRNFRWSVIREQYQRAIAELAV